MNPDKNLEQLLIERQLAAGQQQSPIGQADAALTQMKQAQAPADPNAGPDQGFMQGLMTSLRSAVPFMRKSAPADINLPDPRRKSLGETFDQSAEGLKQLLELSKKYRVQ